jgi:hypothetical protein
MSENTLGKLKWETREKELERKVESFIKEQVEKEKMKHVRLIGTMYVEPLALHSPTSKETKIFEQEYKK